MIQRPSDLSAWDAYLRGMFFLYQFTKEGNREARTLFERAVAIDPGYARGFVGLAYSHHRDLFLGYADDREQSIAGHRAAAQRAVELDSADSMAHFQLGCAYVWAGQFELGIAEEKRAVELNPSNYLGQMALGWAQSSISEFAKAASNMRAALALNPRDPRNHFYMMIVADIHLAMRDHELAASWAQKAIEWHSDFTEAHLFLAASLAHLGREAEARRIIDDLETNTPGAAEAQARSLETRNPADYHHFADGLRKAGLPI